MKITLEMYKQQRRPRFGNANPERMDVPFWEFMAQNKARTAWWAKEEFEATTLGSPVWSFNRFGMSQTDLLDRRVIYIAGEHEDFYDPDFYIYNDVIVFHPDSKIAIFGYPKNVFPPTDFHSATLVGESIYIIGSLGYLGERVPGFTPVYRLDCASLEITTLETYGDNPGWISRHEAHLDAQGTKILIRGGKVVPEDVTKYEDNFQSYQLDLVTLNWQKLNS